MELKDLVTPVLLKNRPGNELHWAIYLGEGTKEEAIEKAEEILNETDT